MISKEMYSGIDNSPDTKLTATIGPTDTVIPVENVGVFPPGPNLATIGAAGTEAETIRYATKTTNSLSGCTRGIGIVPASSWQVNEVIARNYTNQDHEAFKVNIQDLEESKLEDGDSASNVTSIFTISGSRTNLVSGDSLKVIFGKIMKWFSDLKTVAFTGALEDLVQSASYRTVTDTEKSTWNGKQDTLTQGTNITILGNTISAVDTVYTHPSSHPPSIIAQDANNRFVTDSEKTAWNAKQSALGFTPENAANKGKTNGYASLDAAGKVPTAQLPSYVDDVLEFSTMSGFPSTGETGKIYVAIDTNKTYRWSGSGYVEISASLALGMTSATAMRGDYGSYAYSHSLATGNVHDLPLATASANGLMSSAMFTKLNGLYNMVYLTESAFTALGTKDPNTLYLRY